MSDGLTHVKIEADSERDWYIPEWIEQGAHLLPTLSNRGFAFLPTPAAAEPPPQGHPMGTTSRHLIRLQFRGGQLPRAAYVQTLRNVLDVPTAVELYLVRGHWLNVNPLPEHLDRTVDVLTDTLHPAVVGVYAMDDHPDTIAAAAAIRTLITELAGNREGRL